MLKDIKLKKKRKEKKNSKKNLELFNEIRKKIV